MLQIQIALVLSLLAGGGFLVAAFRLGRAAGLKVERRVDLVAGPSTKPQKAVQDPKKLPKPRWIDEAARRVFGVGIPYRWGMRSGAFKSFGIAAASAFLVWLLVYRIFGHSVWLASLFAGAAFFLVPRQILKREQGRAERQFMDLFPNAIEMIIRMLRVGLPVLTAVRTVGAESPPPLNEVFDLISSQSDIGVPFERALDAVSARIGLQDFRFFSVAVTLQYATGGNLAATLETLSDVIRKRRAVRLKGIAATAEVRLSAYVLGAMPILAITVLLVANPDYISPLVNDPRGKYILGAAASLLAMAIFSMRRMMRRVTGG